MSRNEGGLPPHWVAADDQLRAGLRESQRQGRESQAAMWRRAGYSEAEVQKKMADHDSRMSVMHEAMQSGVQGRRLNVAVPGASPSSEPPQHPAKPTEKPRPIARPQDNDVGEKPRRRRPEPKTSDPAWETMEPLPGRASRWLTGYYRYCIGVIAGLVAALVAWIALQGVGQAFLGMTMWSWLSMSLAGVLPLIGLLWWVGEVHREVQHYIDFGGRVPVRFRRW